jgi:4-hydroxy-tetrahydrodipicolinate reductase
MGREVARAVSDADGMEVVAGVDPAFAGKSLGDLCGVSTMEVIVSPSLDDAASAKPDVMVDFTAPQVVKSNVLKGIDLGWRVVWGTTGLKAPEMKEIEDAATAKGVGAFHAANFAIGAALMMILSQIAARHMPALEIIERHHDQKKDAPSGTALRTAEMILEAANPVAPPETEKFLVEGARGGMVGTIPIHSVRLPGYVAHQEVVFGSLAQTLTIRHDSMGRESFMPGVVLAVRKVFEIQGLVVGLEKLLDIR